MINADKLKQIAFLLSGCKAEVILVLPENERNRLFKEVEELFDIHANSYKQIGRFENLALQKGSEVFQERGFVMLKIFGQTFHIRSEKQTAQ